MYNIWEGGENLNDILNMDKNIIACRRDVYILQPLYTLFPPYYSFTLYYYLRRINIGHRCYSHLAISR